MFKRFEKNKVGKDYVVGDIHGCFSKLRSSLEAIDFNTETDRLFSVGDLIDRGEESELVCDWIGKPWFNAVRGNHDDFAIRHVKIGHLDYAYYASNGGAWFMALPADEQLTIADALESLPFAMQIETDKGLFGVVHADSPYENWEHLVEALESDLSRTKMRSITDNLMWSRERAESGYDVPVSGLVALIVGHTPVRSAKKLGNVFYIDTMGWRHDGEFTLIRIQ